MSDQTNKDRMQQLVEENEHLGRAIHADAALVAALAKRVEELALGIREAVIGADMPEETAKTILAFCGELGGGSASHVPGPSMADVAAERDEARSEFVRAVKLAEAQEEWIQQIQAELQERCEAMDALTRRVQMLASDLNMLVKLGPGAQPSAAQILEWCKELLRMTCGMDAAAVREHDLKDALSAIWMRADYIAVHSNENSSRDAATIITHIVEALQGDEGAAAALIVLGVEWPVRRG